MFRLLRLLLVASVTAAPEEAAVQLGFHDCGDSSYHAHVGDLSPMALPTGQRTLITGMTGELDKRPSLFMPPYEGSFSITAKFGPGTELYQGQLDLRKTFHLPQNLGNITWDGMLWHPLPRSHASVAVDVWLSKVLPRGLKGSMEIRAKKGKDNLICLFINLYGPAGSETMVSFPGEGVIEKLACELATKQQIEDKATAEICAKITKKLPIPDCQKALDKVWDKVVAKCPKGSEEAGQPQSMDDVKMLVV